MFGVALSASHEPAWAGFVAAMLGMIFGVRSDGTAHEGVEMAWRRCGPAPPRLRWQPERFDKGLRVITACLQRSDVAIFCHTRARFRCRDEGASGESVARLKSASDSRLSATRSRLMKGAPTPPRTASSGEGLDRSRDLMTCERPRERRLSINSPP